MRAAIDSSFPEFYRLNAAGLSAQRGGVTLFVLVFVHMDTGSVRLAAHAGSAGAKILSKGQLASHNASMTARPARERCGGECRPQRHAEFDVMFLSKLLAAAMIMRTRRSGATSSAGPVHRPRRRLLAPRRPARPTSRPWQPPPEPRARSRRIPMPQAKPEGRDHQVLGRAGSGCSRATRSRRA
jgi:hypothetical protein